jgi:hypothetical protein
MSYAERRGGRRTGIWLAERTVGGERVRFRAESKKAGDAWEALASPIDQLLSSRGLPRFPLALAPLRPSCNACRAGKGRAKNREHSRALLR